MKSAAVAMAVWLAQNFNGVVYLCGFGLLCRGVAGWSIPASQIIAGLCLMAIAAWPYVRPTRK